MTEPRGYYESRGYYDLVSEMLSRIRAGSLTERKLVEAMKGDPEFMSRLLLDLASKGVVMFDSQAKTLTVHEGKASRFCARWE